MQVAGLVERNMRIFPNAGNRKLGRREKARLEDKEQRAAEREALGPEAWVSHKVSDQRLLHKKNTATAPACTPEGDSIAMGPFPTVCEMGDLGDAPHHQCG